MGPEEYWKLFLETGAPECYLMFRAECRRAESSVPEDTRACIACDGVQRP